TFGSANIDMMSAARSWSWPARKPQRLRTLRPSFTLKPISSSATTHLSTDFGSGGGLEGAMRPRGSPGRSLFGKIGINYYVREAWHAIWRPVKLRPSPEKSKSRNRSLTLLILILLLLIICFGIACCVSHGDNLSLEILRRLGFKKIEIVR